MCHAHEVTEFIGLWGVHRFGKNKLIVIKKIIQIVATVIINLNNFIDMFWQCYFELVWSKISSMGQGLTTLN